MLTEDRLQRRLQSLQKTLKWLQDATICRVWVKKEVVERGLTFKWLHDTAVQRTS